MITLLLLPGMHGTEHLFAPLIEALGSDLAIKAVTYPTTGALDYAELETIVRHAVPAEQPFVILGESFSGPIAIIVESPIADSIE